MAGGCYDIGTVRNLGPGTLTIGSGGDFIVANGSDITISTSRSGNTSREIGGQMYREMDYVQHFDTYTQAEVATTSTVNWWSDDTSSTAVRYPEDIISIGGSITFGNYSGMITTATDNSLYWYVHDGDSGIWHIEDITCKPATHYEVMQEKINEAWDLYCRNENHSKNMQKKITKEWDTHLQLEKLAEAERIRLLPEKKANELMSMLIGEKEHKVYEKTGRVFVKGKNGLYMVKRGGGVSKIEGNKIIDFCVHLEHKYNCPPTDHAIALKMLLEDDDTNVIRIANRRMIREVRELPLAACM